MFFLKLIFLFYIFESRAIECEWWQTKVRSHKVKEHDRKNSKVTTHVRQEHCRERWKNSQQLVKLFKNAPPLNWPNKEEFQVWSKEEMAEILEYYSQVPDWLNFQNVTFYRAKMSILTDNHATTDVRTNDIAFYNTCFQKELVKKVLVHELSHVLYKKLPHKEKQEIANLSGWRIEIIKDKIYELPPKKLIKNDSQIDQEEDFSNIIEVYLTQPDKIKKDNFNLFNHLQSRFPK